MIRGDLCLSSGHVILETLSYRSMQNGPQYLLVKVSNGSDSRLYVCEERPRWVFDR